jgi:hypothetical protein
LQTDLWGPIDVSAWRAIPHIGAHVATEADVKAGRAVFYSPSGPRYISNTPYVMPLPAPAILRTEEDPTPVPVIIIQAEQGPDRVIVGYRPLAGGNGVCTLDELELLHEPDSRFHLAM